MDNTTFNKLIGIISTATATVICFYVLFAAPDVTMLLTACVALLSALVVMAAQKL